MSHYGIDLSSNNPHPIDYSALVADLRGRGGGQPFAIVKATQGNWYTNPDFHADIDGFIKAGGAVAAYLMDEGGDDPTQEEAYFRSVAGGLPQYNDDELPGNLTASQYISHCQALLAQNPNAPDYLNQAEENEGFPMGAGGGWEANYNNQPGVTNKAGVLIHQYTSSGIVAGVSGSVDLNFFLGTEAQFAAFFTSVSQPSTTQEEYMLCKVVKATDPATGQTAEYAIRAGDVLHIPDQTTAAFAWANRSNTSDTDPPAEPWENLLWWNHGQTPV